MSQPQLSTDVELWLQSKLFFRLWFIRFLQVFEPLRTTLQRFDVLNDTWLLLRIVPIIASVVGLVKGEYHGAAILGKDTWGCLLVDIFRVGVESHVSSEEKGKNYSLIWHLPALGCDEARCCPDWVHLASGRVNNRWLCRVLHLMEHLDVLPSCHVHPTLRNSDEVFGAIRGQCGDAPVSTCTRFHLFYYF